MLLIYMVYVPQDKIITAGFFLQAPAVIFKQLADILIYVTF